MSRRLAVAELLGAALLAGAPPAPAVGEAPLCVSDEGVYCYDPGSLAPRWQVLAGHATEAPLHTAGLLLVAHSAGLSAFAADGSPRWQLGEFGRAFAPLADAEPGAAYFGTLSGHLVKVDTLAGAPVWASAQEGWLYSPALFAGLAISGGQGGVVYAFERADGRLRWRRDLGQELVYRPVRAGPWQLVVTTFDGRVLLLDARRGRTLWEQRFAVPLRSPVGDGRALYAALFDGSLVALRLADGHPLWRHPGTEPARLSLLGDRLLRLDGTAAAALDTASGALLWRHALARPPLALVPLDDARIGVFVRAPGNLWPAIEVIAP